MDARALRDERRVGRDLSRYDERHHRIALPGLLGGRSSIDPGARRIRKVGHRRRRHLPHAALHLTCVGRRLCHVRSRRKWSARE